MKAPIGRLAFQPLTHPNETYVGETFSLKVTFDGEPLVGQQMELVRENGFYDDDKGKSKVTTNETGVVSLVLDKPGVYLLMTRKRAEAPEGAETDVRGYTTSITFEVTR